MTVIISAISWLARMIGWGGVVAIALLVYEEGIPVIRRIPYIEYVPLIGELAEGRVKTYAAQQVELSKATMVSQVEKDALQAQLDRERELRAAAEQSATEAAKRADAARMAKDQAMKNYEALISADTSPDGAVWTKEDIEWQKQH
ncbi:hypothetical protein GOZ96_04665 [Agrobacterium vitis]|uniref:Uncharacterized protein n=1 Tax=Agrobacterium vitis TaxID=373 RepID=A0A7J4X4I3_AGRVI|nr:hypothetical protein [Agrobacterium vitis]KAA3527037.1 hypothetical protein DXT89_13970 [Agrobacterium vitis]MUZ95881.1 hypothetical protein [Agrobacterium vitis]